MTPAFSFTILCLIRDIPFVSISVNSSPSLFLLQKQKTIKSEKSIIIITAIVKEGTNVVRPDASSFSIAIAHFNAALFLFTFVLHLTPHKRLSLSFALDSPLSLSQSPSTCVPAVVIRKKGKGLPVLRSERGKRQTELPPRRTAPRIAKPLI